MGILSKTKGYLLGALQYTDGLTWRNEVEKELTSLGITVFSPTKKPFINSIDENEETKQKLLNNLDNGNFLAVENSMKILMRSDLRLIDLSDFIFAYINPKVESWGSSWELAVVASQRKILFLTIEGGIKKCPLWLFGVFSHKYMYNSLEESVEMIKKIDQGDVTIDSPKWKLLRPEFR